MPFVFKKSPGGPFTKEFVQSKSAVEVERELDGRFVKSYIGHGLMMLGSTDFENGPLSVVHDAAGYFGSVYFLRITQNKVIDICQDDLIYIGGAVRLIDDDLCI